MASSAADVTVLYFGGVKDVLGCAKERLVVEPPSLAALYERLTRTYPKLPELMPTLRVALNEEFLPGVGSLAIAEGTSLSTGDVIAFIPPVTGG